MWALKPEPSLPDIDGVVQAFQNVLKRMLEASGRGMWNADEETIAKLQTMYQDMDAQLEGVV